MWVPGQQAVGRQGRRGPLGRAHSLPLSSSGLRPSFAVLLLLSATWLLALLSVNSDTLLFHYLFAACNCVQVPGCTPWRWEVRPGRGVPRRALRQPLPVACQGPFIFLSYVVLSKEVRKALKFACSRKPSPDPALTTKSTLTSVREPGTGEVDDFWGREEEAGAPGSSLSVLWAPLFLHPYILFWKEGGVGKWYVWPGKSGIWGWGGGF